MTYQAGKKLRFQAALDIQKGACNPSGVTYALADAFKELYEENADTNAKCTDPAIRLIVHQLAFLCNVAEIDNSLDVYGKLVKACEAQKESGQ